MQTLKRYLGSLVIGALVVGGLAYVGAQAMTQGDNVALAQAEDEAPAAEEGVRNEGGPDGKPGREFHRPAIRGELVVPGDEDGAFETVRLDRGIIERIDGTTVVIKEDDGTVVEILTTGETRISRDREQVAVGDLQPGDHARALRVKDGDGFVTRGVHAISPERWEEFSQRREACRSNPQQCRGERMRRGPRAEGADAPSA